MIGWYCGITLLFPAIGIGIVVIAFKIAPIPRAQPFVAAIAAQSGLALFMLAGGLARPDQISLVIYDVALLAVGLVWLLFWPGLLPVLLLGIYEVYGLLINFDRISMYELGSAPHKGIVATIALRTAAVMALIVGYVKFRRKTAENKQSLPPDPTSEPKKASNPE